MNFKLFPAICLGLILSAPVFAQHVPNWQNKDLQTDSLFGISTEKAYNELLKGKTPHPVIVAVIDAGVDTLHEDLKSILWINPQKKKGDNGTYGWSYLGSAKGNVRYDNLELTRIIRSFQGKDTTQLSGGDLTAYRAEKKDFEQQRAEAQQKLRGYTDFLQSLKAIAQSIGKDKPRLSDVRAFEAKTPAEKHVQQVLINALTQNDDFAAFKSGIEGGLEQFKEETDYQLNLDYDPRSIVGDNYSDPKQRDYGTPDNNGPDPTHGTHVAGIIAGIRNNGLGADGVADNVKILAIRAVPDGDERDKDIANAVRYAADHGAKVINMSFGKAYSPDKKAVDDAMQYALKKDILLVQSAGNDNKNLDSLADFPSRRFLNGKEGQNWIVVGASGLKNDKNLKASFSNYGKNNVDVFAPGVQIYSSIPGSKYDYFDGTSMACPVVAGLAALIREYYPKLGAAQVKEIILHSVVAAPQLSDYCRTGGVVNAFNALQLAADY